MSTDSRVYGLSDAAIRRILLRQDGTWVSMVCSLLLGLGIGLLGRAPFWPLVFVYALFSLLHRRLFRRGAGQKDGWRRFEAILEADQLRVRDSDSVESTINRTEIRRVVEVPGDSLWFYAPGNYIKIPTLLTNYEELRAAVATWSPIQRQRPMQLWRHIGWPAPLAIYVSSLLVRSPYVFFPLFAFAGFYLLRISRLSIKSWQRDGWHWRQDVDSRGFVINEPFWVLAIPLLMLALLFMKLAWILFPNFSPFFRA